MDNIISKELLSAVLNENILSIKEMSDDKFYKNIVMFECRENVFDTINIYELALKCKEWAIKNGFEIMSSSMLNFDEGMQYFAQTRDRHGNDSLNLLTIYGDSEPESIFKACQGILERIKNG